MSESTITTIIILITLWTIPWKGVALWKAAQAKDRLWFVILLVINTLAILEIVYIFFISRRKNNARETENMGTRRSPRIV